MKVPVLGYLFLFLASNAANAQEYAQMPSEYADMYKKCSEEIFKEFGNAGNGAVEACSNKVSEKAKREITKHYKSIYERLLAENPEDARKFEASQKAWLQYRNLHCELAGSYNGSLMYVFCPKELNVARAQELRSLDELYPQ